MEFTGRISKVLPVRSGTSQRRNEWQSLPFVFEYFEHENDRYADSVLLETFDTNIIGGILSRCEHDSTGALVVENGVLKLTREIQCLCGFGHKAKPITKSDGSQITINELRLYKLESVKQAQPAPQPQNQPAQPPIFAPTNNYPPQPQYAPQAQGNAEGGDDDLPF
jgi:hypothetical protein